MHNRPVTALRKLACMQGNDRAVVYGECRDIDGHEVVGEPAWLMLRDKGDCPRWHGAYFTTILIVTFCVFLLWLVSPLEVTATVRV